MEEDRAIAFCLAFAGGAVQAIFAIAVAISFTLNNRNYWGIMPWTYLGVPPQVLVSSGLVFSFLVLAGAFFVGRNRKINFGSSIMITFTGSAIVIIFSLANLFFNGDGLIIGNLLGVIGGAWGHIVNKPDYSSQS